MIVLDAGALVAVDKGDERMRAKLRAATEGSTPIVVPAGALAQVWRDGRTQARVARLLNDLGPDAVAVFDGAAAQRTGELCGKAGTSDVVDASVAVVASQPGTLVLYTSDDEDMERLLETLGGHRPMIVRC